MKEIIEVLVMFINSFVKFIVLLFGVIILSFLCLIKKIKELIKKKKAQMPIKYEEKYSNNNQTIVEEQVENKLITNNIKENEINNIQNNEVLGNQVMNNNTMLNKSIIDETILNNNVNEKQSEYISLIKETFENYGLKILKYNIKNQSEYITTFLCLETDEEKTTEYINFIINYYDKNNKIIYSHSEEYSKEEIEEGSIEIMTDKENIISEIKKIKIFVEEGE